MKHSKHRVNYEIVGAGILHIRSSELIKTDMFKRQLEAAKKIRLDHAHPHN